MFKHMLIPVDAQPLSQHAARLGLEVARQFAARVTLVHVPEVHVPEIHVLEVHPIFALRTEFRASGVLLQRAEKLLEPWVALAEQHAVQLETKLLEIEAGRVAEGVMHHADVPVLLLRSKP